MAPGQQRIAGLLLGEDPLLTRAAVLISGLLVLVAATVEYHALSGVVANTETSVYYHLNDVFRLKPFWD